MTARPTAVRQLRALADEQRLALVEQLIQGPRSVNELVGHMELSRPAVSRHLRVLREAGLVSDTPAGTRRIYRLETDTVRSVIDYLDSLWDEALTAFGRYVDTAVAGDHD